jgi:hypothetical protein
MLEVEGIGAWRAFIGVAGRQCLISAMLGTRKAVDDVPIPFVWNV